MTAHQSGLVLFCALAAAIDHRIKPSHTKLCLYEGMFAIYSNLLQWPSESAAIRVLWQHCEKTTSTIYGLIKWKRFGWSVSFHILGSRLIFYTSVFEVRSCSLPLIKDYCLFWIRWEWSETMIRTNTGSYDNWDYRAWQTSEHLISSGWACAATNRNIFYTTVLTLD